MQRKIRFRTVVAILTAILCLNPVYGQKKLDFNEIFFLEKDSSGGLWCESISSFVKERTINEKRQFFHTFTSIKGDITYNFLMRKSLIINRYYTKGQTIGNEYIYI
ncbi:hypothetical protein HW49_10940 [Porphyromonadaceae bacterium COT-184 OH4590]|nr:hypothetical protein HW49_10940 [Porphyromonadaceae bacterium COT-184 OH4590]